MSKVLESKIQADIIEYLKTLKPDLYFIRTDAGFRINMPDIYVVYKGRAIFLELKTDEGRATDGQKLKKLKLEASGAIHCFPRSVQDVKNIIEGVV